MKKNIKTLRGGGENKSLNNPTSTQTLNSKRIFKPLIASSLALALGVSVASGATTQPATCTSTTGAPSICINGGSDVSTGSGNGNFNITWNDNSPANDTYQPTNTNSTNGSFAFYLEDTDQNQNSGKIVIKQQNGSYKAQIDKTVTTLTINGNGKSLKMGDNGGGSLEFGGGNNKSITLDLSQIASSNYALYGNLKIGSWRSGAFAGTFGGKGISGQITVLGGTNTMDFSGDVDMGNIWIHGGTNTLTFNGNFSNHSGNEAIYAGNNFAGKRTGGNTLTFNGSSNKITTTGDASISVIGGSGSNANNTYNKLIFDNSGTNLIEKAISANGGSNDKNALVKNTIAFKTNTTENTIVGSVCIYHYCF